MENPLKPHVALKVGVRHQRLKSLKMHQLVSLECFTDMFHSLILSEILTVLYAQDDVSEV